MVAVWGWPWLTIPGDGLCLFLGYTTTAITMMAIMTIGITTPSTMLVELKLVLAVSSAVPVGFSINMK